MTRGPIVLPVALVLPPIAWMTFEFGLVATLRPACAAARWLGPLWGGVAVLACVLSFVAARRTYRERSGKDRASDRWTARVAMLGAGVFALAILFQTLATLIVPPCVR
jgi:hypothetical protein